jgi:hypothetical protein
MNIILNKDQQRRPFGGHHFPEMGMVLRSEKFEDLVKRVKEVRIINGNPIGNPEQEILRYYAERFPFMVKSGQSPDQPIVPSDYLKWRDWIRLMWFQAPNKIVSRKEASTRWEKCLACPMNRKIDWAVGEEAKEFEKRSFLIRHGQNTPDNLGFCTCHRWDSRVVVFLDAPEKLSNKREGDTQPPECFVSDGAK